MPSERAIPDDVMAKARRVYGGGAEFHLLDIARAILAERDEAYERAAKALRKWKGRDHLLLHAGEVSAQEFRTVVAVLIAIEGELRALQEHPNG